MGLSKGCLRRTSSPLIDFFGDVIPIKGIVTLLVTADRALRWAMILLDVMVVKVLVAYNTILKKLILNCRP